TAVWAAPERNPWATITMGTIAKHVELPAQPAGAPGLFRCAAPGYMSKVFAEAGLKNVSEREVAVPITFQSPEQYWSFITEVAAPVVTGLAKADETPRAKIKSVVIGLASKMEGGKTRLGGLATVICGEK